MIDSKDISFRFSEDIAREVLHKVSFQVKPGTLLAVVGPSGCGKTTLLRILSGYLKPSDGTVRLDEGAPNPSKQIIGIKYQDNKLLPWRNLIDNISLPDEVQGKFPAPNRALELLRLCRLSDHMHKFPSHLSGGQQERTALARALMPTPRFLFLDEPLGSTDYVHRLEIEDYIYEFVRRENVCCVLITHDLEQAVALADEVIILGYSTNAHNSRKLNVPEALRAAKPSAARTHAAAPAFLKFLLSEYSDVVKRT